MHVCTCVYMCENDLGAQLDITHFLMLSDTSTARTSQVTKATCIYHIYFHNTKHSLQFLVLQTSLCCFWARQYLIGPDSRVDCI